MINEYKNPVFFDDSVIHDFIVAGWTGRNESDVLSHINELRNIGVEPPEATPTFCRLSPRLLTKSDEIAVVGPETSGEVEFCIINHDDEIYISVCSDHTDRKIETIDIQKSKQLCDKPVGRMCWRFDDVKNHWDELFLKSYVEGVDGVRLYQEGSVRNIKLPEVLVEDFGGVFPRGAVMFCGTVPVIGMVMGGFRFSAEIVDPVLNRRLELSYKIKEI